MTTPTFVVADLRTHRNELVQLNVEYFSWVFSAVDTAFGVRCADFVGSPAAAYAEAGIDKVCRQAPPDGIFYLITVDGAPAGMGGLRGLGAKRAEVKRIFVRPAFRGHQFGARILNRLLADAVSFGYDRVCLETGPFMKSAHRVYENAKFVDREPYPEAEVPAAFHARWRFMERSLSAAGHGA